MSFVTATVVQFRAVMGLNPFMFYSFFAGMGYGTAIIVGLVVFALCEASLNIFIRCWTFGRSVSEPQVFGVSFGKRSSAIPSILIIVAYTSIIMSHIRDFLGFPAIMHAFGGDVPGPIADEFVILYILSAFFALPFLYFDDFRCFWLPGYANMVAMVAGIVTLLVYRSRPDADETFYPNFAFGWNATAAGQLIAGLVPSMLLHVTVGSVLRGIQHPTRVRCHAAMLVAMASSLVLNIVPSVLVMREPPAFFALCSLIVSGTSVSMETYLVATELESLMFPGAPTRFCAGLAIVALGVALQFVPALVRSVINFARTLCFMLLGFVIPAACFLRVVVTEGTAWKVTAWIVLIVGIAGFLFLIYPFVVNPRTYTRVPE
jgi:hypothetical protein